MKPLFKNALFLIVLLMNMIVVAQTESTITRVKYKLVPFPLNPDIISTKEEKDYIEKTDIARDKVECELNFTKNKSAFNLIDKPLFNHDFDYLREAIIVESYYKDAVSKKKTRFGELGGEKLNTIIPYNQYNWEITTETKKINNYTCYKAICKWEDFNIRRNSIYVYNAEAWFTPEIPVSFGPMGLDGLPGLVLEASYGANGVNFCVTKIEFDVVDAKIKLDTPAVKYVTEEEYLKRLKKDYENMDR